MSERSDCLFTALKIFWFSCLKKQKSLPNAEPACSSPTQPWHPINTAVLTTERGGIIECVFYTFIGPADPECNVGTLNTETEMCEVKPGNRPVAAAAAAARAA